MSEQNVVETPAAASTAQAGTTKKDKKKKKETYRLIRMLLKVDEIQSRKDTFPSDQFIMRNLPDAIRKTEGASSNAKTVMAFAGFTALALVASIAAPITLLATGVIGTGLALLGGAIGMGVAVAGGLATRNETQEFVKEHGEGLGKYLISKHIVDKSNELRDTWSSKKKERQQKREAAKAAKAAEKAAKAEQKAQNDNTAPDADSTAPKEESRFSKLLSGAKKLSDTWDEATTQETKEKAKESLKNAGDTAKKKLGGFYDKIKNRGKGGNNK